MQSEAQENAEQDHISLSGLMDVLWRRRWLILCVTVTLTIGTGCAALIVPVKYQASIVGSPVSDDSSSGRMSDVAAGHR